ncbi:MAG: M48 family metalloprotease [Thermoplasmataceae archaeon]
MNSSNSRIKKTVIFYTVSLLVYLLIVTLYPVISMSFDSSMLSVTIFVIVTSIGNFVIQSQSGGLELRNSPRFLNNYSIKNLIMFKDESLSRKYSEKFKYISKDGVAIYSFENTGKFPPAFTRILHHIPDIFVDERFFSYLDQADLETLILHELGHFTYRVDYKKRVLANLFLLSLAFSILSSVLIFILGSINQLFFIPVILVSISLLSFILILYITINSEFSADRFGATQKGDTNAMINLLMKIQEFVSIDNHSRAKKLRVKKQIDRRIKRLKDEAS